MTIYKIHIKQILNTALGFEVHYQSINLPRYYI